MKKILFLLALTASVPTFGQTLVAAKPEEAGMSSERLAKIDRYMEDCVAKKWFPGVVVLVARNGKVVLHKAYGVSDIEKQTALKKDDLFRIASQTKAITSTAIMMLYEEGKLLLDDPLYKYIPEFKNPRILTSVNPKDSTYTTKDAGKEITIRQLLTHTSGIDYAGIGSTDFKMIYAKAKIPTGLDMPNAVLADKIKSLGRLPLKHAPGDAWTYGLSVDVLGYVVEVVSGMTLDEFFHKRIFAPLGMSDTYFYLPQEKQKRLVPIYSDTKGTLSLTQKNPGLMPDYPMVAGTYYSGGGGLTSSIEDYAKFLQMFLNGGHYNGATILSRKTIELMLTNQTKDMEMQFGLGFELETPKNDYQSPFSIGSFSWGGAFNTYYWSDPKEKLTGLIFKQIAPTTHGDVNDKFASMVYGAIAD